MLHYPSLAFTCIHGDDNDANRMFTLMPIDLYCRDRVLAGFKSGRHCMLVATVHVQPPIHLISGTELYWDFLGIF